MDYDKSLAFQERHAMRSVAMFLLVAGTMPFALGAKRVTVAQLQQEIAALQGESDAKAAQQLADVQLIERLSDAKLAQLQAEVPGSNSRQAVLVLADTSAFLNLPLAEVPHTPAPDLADQQRILTRTIHYVARTVRQLPNFSAWRVTTRFEDVSPDSTQGERPQLSYGYKPFHRVGTFNVPVLFRDGREIIGVAAKSKRNEPALSGLTTGEFGPILFTVLLDIAHNTIKWDHWELNLDKTLAVFAFSVPREQSHYQAGSSSQFSGYHGEIAVDPVDGAVYRIVVQADLKPTDPISRADILVEYGPVEIGGRPYISPMRSVAILVDNTVPTLTTQNFPTQRISPTINGESLPPHTETQLDDVAFTQYHLFRAESRIIAGDTVDNQDVPSSSGPATTPR
jgi:hypothetical protein